MDMNEFATEEQTEEQTFDLLIELDPVQAVRVQSRPEGNNGKTTRAE